MIDFENFLSKLQMLIKPGVAEYGGYREEPLKKLLSDIVLHRFSILPKRKFCRAVLIIFLFL